VSDLPTDVVAGTEDHPGLHNDVNAAVNEHLNSTLHVPGTQADYAENSVQITGVAGTAVDLGVAVDFVVADNDVEVVLNVSRILAVTNTWIGRVMITDSANTELACAAASMFVTGTTMAVVKYLITTPGTYSGLKGRIIRIDGTGTASVGHTAGDAAKFKTTLEAIYR
jgi:hypothetical protein